jgi:hypothetical protein
MQLSYFNTKEEFADPLKDLSKTVQDNLGGPCKISILDINNKEVSMDKVI